jgi:hypothetical protein
MRPLTLAVVEHIKAHPGTNRHTMRKHFHGVSWQTLYAAVHQAVKLGALRTGREPGDVVDRLYALKEA